MPIISAIVILALLVILLTIFVGRALELITMRMQQRYLRPALENNLEKESIKPARQPSR